MTRTCGEEAGGGVGGQVKKILVFHGLGPEKNETGERLKKQQYDDDGVGDDDDDGDGDGDGDGDDNHGDIFR